MLTLVILPEEQTQLRALARTTKDKKTADRIRIILALADGHSAKHVAELFLLDEDTITDWKKKYQKRRLFSDWLASGQQSYNGKLSDDQLRELEAHVEAETITDALAVVEFIQARFGEAYTINGATKLLHRLGFVYKHTTLIPGKLDEVKQATFKQEYEQLRDNLPEDEVILFADGVHPSHNVHATKAWIKKGQEKQVPTNTGRKRLNINGVLELEAMQAVTHFADTLNAETTLELFDKVQQSYPNKAIIHLICDNARYYKNKDVVAYLEDPGCRIELRFLPSYSPNLNFIERLWHFLKKYIIGIKRRETFKEFEADVRAFFDHMGDYEARLRKLIGTQMHLITLNA
jgi:transposase